MKTSPRFRERTSLRRAVIRSVDPHIMVALASGALMGWCLPAGNESYALSVTKAILAWVALVPAAVVSLRALRWQTAAVRMAAAGVAYHGVCMWFLVHLHPLSWLGLSHLQSLATSAGAWLGASLLGGVLWGGFGAMLSLLRVVAGFGAWLPLQACLLWLLVAWLQPWADLHLSQAAVPAMVQMASWFGALAIEAALVLANVALACTYLTRRLDLRFLPQVVVLPTLLAAHGSSQLASEAPGVSKLQVTVAQAGLEAGNERGFRDYLPLAEVAREQGSQLLVLPEGAAGAQDLSKLSRIIPVLAGTHWHGHNSALHLGGDTTQLYHKRILVPFGEHLPFPGLRAISPGRRPGVIGGLGPIICFEVSVSHLAAEQVQAGAEALVVLGDVSWFAGASQQVSSQMLAMARLRAVEMGREVLLTANRGLVAHVDSKGRVSKRDRKLLTTELNLRQEPSVYALGS